jgi:hypothetical protein
MKSSALPSGISPEFAMQKRPANSSLGPGVDLLILALAEAGDFFLMCVGDHDAIRAYVKGNPKPSSNLAALFPV